LELEFPPDYPTVLPGQYLNLRTGTAMDPLFRRPFGVCEFRREDEAAVVEIYYGVVGRGTGTMATWRSGDSVDCLGPLGTAYEVDPARPAVLVAGGRGAAPLLYLHRLLKNNEHSTIRFAFGAQSANLLFGLGRLDEENLLVATEDGSVGHRGNIVEALSDHPTWLADGGVLYACGPERFLEATAALAGGRGLSCQVSLEGVYACGLGLCRGCAVPLKGESRFLMQCIEGPVVDAARIDWDRMPRE
jgi:dihydroorotate dehydrogenase electron transfer subunit